MKTETTSENMSKTHLEYYEQHKISPVSYDLSDMEAHLQRRESLYTMLGIPPIAFRSSKILEVAAGTGHNSLYLAKQMPSELTLLEPNSTGINFIHEAYTSFSCPHTKPKIVTSKLEDYFPAEQFDVVLCENWLGCSSHEVSLLQKLSSFVNQDGLLVLTTVSPIGFVPNLLRRFLSACICPVEESFENKTEIIVKELGPHLDTLANMTRNKTDWVHDNMLNPAYFDLCLTIPKVIEELGDNFRVIGSSPSFCEDWRWFKNLYGSDCQWNQHFLSEYWRKAHCFLDYRHQGIALEEKENYKLETCALKLLQAIEQHENAYLAKKDSSSLKKEVLTLLKEFISLIPKQLNEAIMAFSDAHHLISHVLEGKRELFSTRFDSLFSKETTYVALSRIN